MTNAVAATSTAATTAETQRTQANRSNGAFASTTERPRMGFTW